MKNRITIVVIVVLALVAAFVLFSGKFFTFGTQTTAADYKNISYAINGQQVKLTNGMSEVEAAPGSASKVVTKYFGNEIRKDVNDDGREDVAFLLTQTSGGSGTYFYIVVALNTQSGYIGSSATLLGDRIAPQSTDSGNGGLVIVNYADRKPGEPMTAQPSVAKSLVLLFNPQTMEFDEIVPEFGFEGEADPSVMKLDMKKWNWKNALYNDGRTIAPKTPNKFSITFSSGGRFTATTDCNSMSGSYVASGSQLVFGEIAMTKMFCEGSQENEFASLLQTTSGYHFTSKGELIFDLKFDSGSAVFN